MTCIAVAIFTDIEETSLILNKPIKTQAKLMLRFFFLKTDLLRISSKKRP